MEESNPELESFRQQWRAEVSAKGRSGSNGQQTSQQSKQPRKQVFAGLSSSSTSTALPEDEDHDDTKPTSHSTASRKLDSQHNDHHGETSKHTVLKEPKSALEHYEKAVERESQGNLGDSLDLYRKAFRVSHRHLHLWI
jgi:F-box protein 9